MSHQKIVNSSSCSIYLAIAECRIINDTLKIKLKHTSNSLARQVIQGSFSGELQINLRLTPPIHTNLKPIPPLQLILQCETFGMMKKILMRLGLISSNHFTLSTMLSVGSSIKIELNGRLRKFVVTSTIRSPSEESLYLSPLKDATENFGETTQAEK